MGENVHNIKINYTFCKHNANNIFQKSSPRTGLKLSRPEAHE
jgi:hypothetical protein